MARQIVVVDCETSALVPGDRPYGVATEVAWWNLATGEARRFVPRHSVHHVRAIGDPQALVVSRYLERLVDAEQDDGTEVRELFRQLDGNTLAGSNPAFDARFLRDLFVRHNYVETELEPWHHRLLDLSCYAAGKLDLPGHELPGLAALCEQLTVEHRDPHTAMGDAVTTGACFARLGVETRSVPYPPDAAAVIKP